jgi:anti-sigma regulatory factor (Ser/Thr protein kinase)
MHSTVRCALAREPQAPARARSEVAIACRGLSRDLFEVALLLTSELVTNALKHGVGDIELVIRLDDRLRVEVYDQAPELPRRVDSAPLADLGRGLMLVERLSSRWGAERVDGFGEKRVWFELALSRQGSRDVR